MAAALPKTLADTSATSRRSASVTSSAPESLPTPDTGDDESPPAEEVPATPIAEREEGWRYRYHLGRWWYYVERKHWLYWDGQCWQDARPQTPKVMPDGSVQRPGLVRRALAAWPQVPSYREHHGWIGGFYSSGGGYGSSDFGYGYGIPSYGPGAPYVNGELSGPSRP
jgi:hypothetical protein